MFKILSVQYDNFKDKFKSFFQLKFSQLTIILYFTTFFNLFDLSLYIITIQILPGTFSWELSHISPFLLYFGIAVNILVITFGMTNWKNFKKIYCFICRKSCKICSTEDDEIDSSESEVEDEEETKE